jgi:hypothetical protein
MKAPFGPGDVVVCVEGHNELGLEKGKIYMISNVGGRIFGVRLFSGPNPPELYPNSDGTVSTGFWRDSRFRLYEPPKPEVKTTEKAKEKTE